MENIVINEKEIVNAEAISAALEKIAAEENAIEESYKKLGKIYYELNASAPDFEYAEIVGAVNASNDNIAALRGEILALRGVIICPDCGAEASEDAVSCKVCGHKFREDITENGEPICPSCKSVLPVGSVFCNCCGAKIGEAAPAPAPAVKTCPVCGKNVSEDSAFCNYCGASMLAPVAEEIAEEPAEIEAAPDLEIPDAVIEESADEADAVANDSSKAQSTEEIKSLCSCCGMVLSKGLMFCTNCGTRVGVSNDPSRVAAPAAPEANEVSFAKEESSCTNCGMPLAKGLMFCTNCGTKAENKSFSDNVRTAPSATAKKICSCCKAELADGLAFCTNCGTKVENAAPAEKENASGGARLCISCGKEVPAGAKFCINCGTRQ